MKSMKGKLILLFILASALPLLINATVSYFQSSSALLRGTAQVVEVSTAAQNLSEMAAALNDLVAPYKLN